MKQDIFIFGASKSGEAYWEYLKRQCSLIHVLGFIDNDSCKWGSSIKGIPVFCPDHLSSCGKDIQIVIASHYHREIGAQLEAMGFENYFVGTGPDKYVEGALYEFRIFTKKRIYAQTLNVSKNWKDRVPASLIDENARVAAQVLASYQRMCHPLIPAIYKPGFAWDACIGSDVYDLYGAMQRFNPQRFEELIFEFRQYGTVLGISAAEDVFSILDPSFSDRDLVNNVVGAYECLRGVLDEKIAAHLDESMVGEPLVVHYKKRRLTSLVLRHAFYVQRIQTFLATAALPLEGKQVFIELGGGTGDMARQMIHYFQDNMVYVILDLPEVLTISSYYLLRNFPGKKIGLYDDFSALPVISREDLTKYDMVLLPNHFIERLADDTADLFINTASLGEMEEDIVNNYLEQINRTCQYLFYSNNRDRGLYQIDGEYRAIGLDDFTLGNHWEVMGNRSDFQIFNAIIGGLYREKVFLKAAKIK